MSGPAMVRDFGGGGGGPPAVSQPNTTRTTPDSGLGVDDSKNGNAASRPVPPGFQQHAPLAQQAHIQQQVVGVPYYHQQPMTRMMPNNSYANNEVPSDYKAMSTKGGYEGNQPQPPGAGSPFIRQNSGFEQQQQPTQAASIHNGSGESNGNQDNSMYMSSPPPEQQQTPRQQGLVQAQKHYDIGANYYQHQQLNNIGMGSSGRGLLGGAPAPMGMVPAAPHFVPGQNGPVMFQTMEQQQHAYMMAQHQQNLMRMQVQVSSADNNEQQVHQQQGHQQDTMPRQQTQYYHQSQPGSYPQGPQGIMSASGTMIFPTPSGVAAAGHGQPMGGGGPSVGGHIPMTAPPHLQQHQPQHPGMQAHPGMQQHQQMQGQHIMNPAGAPSNAMIQPPPGGHQLQLRGGMTAVPLATPAGMPMQQGMFVPSAGGMPMMQQPGVMMMPHPSVVPGTQQQVMIPNGQFYMLQNPQQTMNLPYQERVVQTSDSVMQMRIAPQLMVCRRDPPRPGSAATPTNGGAANAGGQQQQSGNGMDGRQSQPPPPLLSHNQQPSGMTPMQHHQPPHLMQQAPMMSPSYMQMNASSIDSPQQQQQPHHLQQAPPRMMMHPVPAAGMTMQQGGGAPYPLMAMPQQMPIPPGNGAHPQSWLGPHPIMPGQVAPLMTPQQPFYSNRGGRISRGRGNSYNYRGNYNNNRSYSRQNSTSTTATVSEFRDDQRDKNNGGTAVEEMSQAVEELIIDAGVEAKREQGEPQKQMLQLAGDVKSASGPPSPPDEPTTESTASQPKSSTTSISSNTQVISSSSTTAATAGSASSPSPSSCLSEPPVADPQPISEKKKHELEQQQQADSILEQLKSQKEEEDQLSKGKIKSMTIIPSSQKECSYCKNKKKTPAEYTGHTFRESTSGIVVCEDARQNLECGLCGNKGGDQAHAKLFCPNKVGGSATTPSATAVSEPPKKTEKSGDRATGGQGQHYHKGRHYHGGGGGSRDSRRH